MKKAMIFSLLATAILPFAAPAQPEATGWVSLEPVKTKVVYLNDINTRAAGDFVKRFSDVKDARWLKAEDGFLVKFKVNGIDHKTAYKKTGAWVYTIRFYKEAKMPRDIRHIVKSRYYDYSISQVEEVHYLKNPVTYIVHMQDETTWMNVKVCEGELSILEKYKKK